MLADFLKRVKPTEYSFQILSGSTSQTAVKRVKHHRSFSPLKAVTGLLLIATAFTGLAASVASSTAVASKQAQADIFTDTFCINGNDSTDAKDEAGLWTAGTQKFANMGGKSSFTMEENASDIASDVAIFGFAATSWGDKEYMTAYEKYGMNYPIFDAWHPVFADKDYTFRGVGTTDGSTYNVNGHIPTSSLSPSTVTAGASGLTTSNVFSCIALLPAIEAGVANLGTIPSRFIIALGLEFYGASYGTSISQEGSILKPIGDQIDSLITKDGGLRDALFVPFVMPLLLIGAIWVAYVGIIKRAAMLALQSTAWMIAAIAFGTVFLAQPTLISSFIDGAVAEVQQIINEAVLSVSNDMCDISDDPAGNTITREVQCSIWYSTIYAPWVSGQFGTSVTSAESADPNKGGGDILTGDPRGFLATEQAKIQYGSATSQRVTPVTWPQFQLDRQATTKSFEISEVAYAQLSGASAMGVNGVWAGGSLSQISAAILMFFGSIASSLVLFVFGIILFIYQLIMITAVMMSPFFFLLGIVPNWGRRVLMRYAEILVSLAVKRIITSFMLAVYLIFYQLISGTGPLLLQLLLIAVLAIFAVTSRGKFVNMFTQGINFGGNKSIGLPGGKAAAITVGIGGAIAGGLLAGPVGALVGGIGSGKAMRKGNKDMEQGKDMNLAGSPTADVKKPGISGPPAAGPNTGSAPPASSQSPTADVGKKVEQTARLASDVHQGVNRVKNGKTAAETARTTQAANTAKAEFYNGATQRATETAVHTSKAAVSTSGAAASGTVTAGGAAASGAAATGGAVAAGGAAAAGGGAVAAGGAAAIAGGAAAGAAAGSVVPVVGTAAGAAVGIGAAAVAAKMAEAKKKKQQEG